MPIFSQRLPPDPAAAVSYTLALTAEERQRSRYRYDTAGGEMVLQLPRGTVLYHGDLLVAEDGSLARIIANPEPVLTVTGSPYDLLRAAYHLGNRHVPLEIKPDYLRLSPDSVLEAMVQQLGLNVVSEISPFQPETGAYGHHH